MRLDVSSESFDRGRDFTRVFLQQGRPLLDRDWNEHTSIVLNQLRAAGRAIYGYHGGPPGKACGFVPYEKDGELWLRQGQYVIDGLPFECDKDYLYAAQKYGAPTGFEREGIQLVYLEVMEREVLAAEDASLLDSALPGIDVAARGQAVWRARHCDWSSNVDQESSDYNRKAVEKANEWEIQKRNEQRPPESMNASAFEELSETLKGRANQFLRLECHEVGGASGSVWKFSADNGFPLFRILNCDAGGARVTVSLGNLASWKPTYPTHDIVELLTLEQLQFGEPGLLRQVESTPASNEQTISSANQADVVVKGHIPEGVRFLRPWHKRFVLDNHNGLHPGDYWQHAVREQEANLKRMSLMRKARYCVPLALVEVSEGGAKSRQYESKFKVSVLARFQRVVGIPWREVDEVVEGLAEPGVAASK